MNTNLWWIRRDLRLMDNQAIQAARAGGDKIVPVFVLDPALLNSAFAGENRVAFLMAGLRELDKALRDRGSYLVVRQGRALEELGGLMEETSAAAIYAEEDVSPYARRRDMTVSQHLPLNLVGGAAVHHPDLIYKADGLPCKLFTPFSRRWKELPSPKPGSLLPVTGRLTTPPGIGSLPIPNRLQLSKAVPFVPGEEEAQRRLKDFLKGDNEVSITRYAVHRDRMDLNGTSGLSPYLRFGMVSPRQVVVSVQQKRSDVLDDRGQRGVEAWLNELIWREFYMSILYHFPQVLRQNYRAAYNHIVWRNNEDHYNAWRDGQTGYPVVDAAMRQLRESGWMHNRARMITASFLVKDLLIDWHWGERWFMQQLVDGDPAANNGGWQWTAGTGTDAAPYFRIFNPVLQGRRFDPHGNYVRRWLPELAKVPERFLHEPWRMPITIQQHTNCVIGRDYPQPIVDHSQARKATLAAYAQARGHHLHGD